MALVKDVLRLGGKIGTVGSGTALHMTDQNVSLCNGKTANPSLDPDPEAKICGNCGKILGS